MATPPQVLNEGRKGMRLLLISDTHGKLSTINELSSRVQADAVIHAGDFGFYEDGSFERLSDRELRLQVAHSGLPQAEKKPPAYLLTKRSGQAVTPARPTW
jgi:hypothetical protein